MLRSNCHFFLGSISFLTSLRISSIASAILFNCSVYQDKEIEIANRFTGEKTKMPGYAASVYDTIIGAERVEAWDIVRAGLDWFREHFPKQYMVVLD